MYIYVICIYMYIYIYIYNIYVYIYIYICCYAVMLSRSSELICLCALVFSDLFKTHFVL